MRSDSFKSFWAAFLLTAVVLIPFIAGTLLWVQVRQDRVDRVSRSQSGVRIVTPTTRHRHTLLLAVPGEEALALVLARLDAPANRLQLAVIPAEGVVLAGQQPMTLAQAYAGAGPARVTQLLQETLDIPIDGYLAITADRLGKALGSADHLRAGLSGALTEQQLTVAGLEGDAADYTAQSGHELLAGLQALVDSGQLSASALGQARAALWDAALRQNLERLPATLPDGLRQVSDRTLTSLAAQDYYTLAETLEFLANQKAAPTAGLLPGQWNAAESKYEFDDATLDYLHAFFSASAAEEASSARSAP